MELKKLKFFLESEGETYELKQSPSGWEDTLIEYLKSPTYYGMLRSVTVPLEFVTNGAAILRRDYYTRATAATTWLIIQELNPKTYAYEQRFKGKIDYSKFKDQDNRVTVNVLESGITEYVKAYEKVVYEIPLATPNSVKIDLPGVGLTEVADAIIEPDRLDLSPVDVGFNRRYLLGTDIVLNELESEALTIQSQTAEVYTTPGFLATSENWLIRANVNTTFSFRIKILGRYGVYSSSAGVRLVLKNQNDEVRLVVREFIGLVSGNQFKPLNIDETFTYEIPQDEKLFLVFEYLNALGGWMQTEEGSYEISNSLVTSSSEVYALTAYEVFRQLIQKMAGSDPIQTNSYLLLTEWKKLKITSGDAIRGINSPVLKTSFIDFFNAVNSLLCVGFGVENGIAVLEKRDYFSRANTVIDLGEVSEYALDPALNHLFSRILVGYNDEEYESEYGREEYNASQEWTTPNTRVQTEYNIVSPYRADQIGIEELRTTSNQDNVTATDTKSDNDTFFIVTKEEPNGAGVFEVEGAEAYRSPDGISGLTSRNAYYNLSISPKKNLLRHGAYLRSSLFGIVDRNILFQSATKNAALVTIDLQGNRVVERQSIPINSLAAPYFLPMLAEFKTDLPVDAVKLLDAGLYGKVRFTVKGVELFGYLEKAGVNLPRNSSQKWKVLLAVGSNLAGLIR
jgi:hypothetical protein